MNYARFTAGVLFLLVGAASVCAANAPSAPPPKSREDDRTAFLERMKRVQEGWTEKRVVDLVGEPKEKSAAQWFYKWIEDSRWGGYYEIFVFTMKDGHVAKIDHSFGHESRSPAR